MARVLEGAQSLRRWHFEHPGEVLDLAGAELSNRDLHGCDFTSADLRFTRLQSTDLHGAVLAGCDLQDAMFSHADLRLVNLQFADLQSAVLDSTDLSSACLASSDLENARIIGCRMDLTDLTKSRWGETGLYKTDISRCLGLDSTVHVLPSSIDVDTMRRTFRGSDNFAPSVSHFLMLAGIAPGNLHRVVEAFAAGPHARRRLFVVSAARDRMFTKELIGKLHEAPLPCWHLDPDPSGLDILDIDDCVIVLSSEDLLRASAATNLLELLAVGGRGLPNWRYVTALVDGYLFRWKHPLRNQLMRSVRADFRSATVDSDLYLSALGRLFVAALQ